MRRIKSKERRKRGNIYCPYCKPIKKMLFGVFVVGMIWDCMFPVMSIKTNSMGLKIMGRWGFEEQKDGSVLRHKIEKQETVTANALSALKTISAFPGKDGKDDFDGFDNMKNLETIKDSWLNSVYSNVQTAHKAWKEKYDNSTETTPEPGDGNLPF